MRTAFDLAAGVPWLITEEGLEQLLAIAARDGLDLEAARLAAEAQANSPEMVALRAGQPLDGAFRASLRDGVAILPVTGPIFRYANLMTWISGATSTQMLARDFQLAVDNPEVRAILLNFDTPGGQATGIAELAATIRAARTVKPVSAYVGDMAASGGYWLASAASEIVLSPTGMVGSIGAVMVGSDSSSRDAAQGVRRFAIASSLSPKKALDPASRAGADEIQNLVDMLAERFVAAVAANRGVSIETVVNEFGQGGLVPRAEDAIRRGMADRIGSFETLITDLAGAGSPPSRVFLSAAPAAGSDDTMEITTIAALAAAYPNLVDEIRANAGALALTNVSAAALAAANPALVETLRAEGRTAAVAGERERIAQIMSKTLPGHAELRDKAVAGGMSYSEFLEAQVAAEQQKNVRRLEGLRGDETASPRVAAMPTPTGEQADAITKPAVDQPLEERVKTEWDNSAELRSEFGGDYASYLAYRRADEAGQVRRLGK